MPNTAQVPVQLDNVQQFYAPLADKLHVQIQALVGVVIDRMTASKGGQQPTAKELIEYGALCNQAGLNPTTSEVAPLVQGGRVSLIIGVDGWIKVARSYPEFRGYKLVPSEDLLKVGIHEVPKYIDSQIFIKGYDFPLEWRTYYNEAVKAKSPVWQSQPNHMLQVRALANGVKRAFGLNAYTPDEAFSSPDGVDELETSYSELSTKGKAKILNAIEHKAPQVFSFSSTEEVKEPVQTQSAEPEKAEPVGNPDEFPF